MPSQGFVPRINKLIVLFIRKHRMAFNPNDYVKPSAKPFVQRAVDPAVSAATGGLAASSRNIAATTAESLFIAGSASQAVAGQTNSQADVLSSSVADEYYALANKSVARASRSDIASARMANKTHSDKYINRTAPQAKISKAREGKTVQVITIR